MTKIRISCQKINQIFPVKKINQNFPSKKIILALIFLWRLRPKFKVKTLFKDYLWFDYVRQRLQLLRCCIHFHFFSIALGVAPTVAFGGNPETGKLKQGIKNICRSQISEKMQNNNFNFKSRSHTLLSIESVSSKVNPTSNVNSIFLTFKITLFKEHYNLQMPEIYSHDENVVAV